MQVEVLFSESHEIGVFELDGLSEAKPFYPRVPGIRFNYVVSAMETNKSDSYLSTNEVDRLFLRAIRANADLIITTGKTAREENLKGSSLTPLLILTNEKELQMPATNAYSEKKVFVTNNQENMANPNAESLGFLDTNLSTFTKKLMMNYQSIALESGLSTALEYSKLHLLNEICLTVTNATEPSAIAKLEDFMTALQFDGSVIQVMCSERTWLFRVKPKNS